MFKETEKFIIEVKGIIENDVFEEFFKNFSNGFDAIDSFFEINYDKLKIYLLSKEDLNKVVKEKSNQYKNIDVNHTACVKCGKCKEHCPQGIDIPNELAGKINDLFS